MEEFEPSVEQKAEVSNSPYHPQSPPISGYPSCNPSALHSDLDTQFQNAFVVKLDVRPLALSVVCHPNNLFHPHLRHLFFFLKILFPYFSVILRLHSRGGSQWDRPTILLLLFLLSKQKQLKDKIR